MSKTLYIQYAIPFGDEGWVGPRMTFYQWLPDGENEGLIRQKNNITVRLWVDKDCIANLNQIDEEYISRWTNVSVNKVYVDIEILDVSEDLAEFIYHERDSPREVHHGISPEHEEYATLKNEYEALGLKVLKAALTAYNRFIAFARNYKAQHWLHERPFDENRLLTMNNAFRAKVRSEDHDWVRWCPPGTDTITIYAPGRETSIKREEWKQFQEFVASDSRPDITLELLANAQLLVAKGHRRSAIIEAVSALEIAVNNFAEKGKLDKLVTNDLLSRFDAKQLQSQIEHLGFSGSLRFLLPILFPAEVLPTEVLKNCQEAINIRHNVVHNKQRDVDEMKARPLIADVRRACEILMQHID